MYKFTEKDCDWPMWAICPPVDQSQALKWVPGFINTWSRLHTRIKADGVCYQKIGDEEFGWAITIHYSSSSKICLKVKITWTFVRKQIPGLPTQTNGIRIYRGEEW